MAFDATAQSLSSLRDVEGVQGSFVLNELGQLVGTDLPALLHDDTFGETGPRIVRLCEALEHGSEPLESVAVRFVDHKLHVRRAKGGYLCVVANLGANAPALKMALSLVARRLGTTSGAFPAPSSDPLPSLAAGRVTASPQPVTPAPQTVSIPAPPSSKSLKTYRGRSVD